MAGQGWNGLDSGRPGRSQHDKFVTVRSWPYQARLVLARPGRAAWPAPQDERMTWFGPEHEKRKAYLIMASLQQYV